MEEVIRTAIEDVLKELGIGEVDFVVEHPNELSHGDYSCNVAMVAAKLVGKNPRELAEEIAQKLEEQIEYVEKIDIAGPGFINFHLTHDFFTREIARINTLGEDWGKHDSQNGEVVLIEYTSPNLFKPLHVGNLVGNIIGESFTRLYEFAGAEVKRMNYPSDIGLPVAKAVWGLQKTSGDPGDIDALGAAYRVGNEAFEKEGEEKEEIITINKVLYEESDETLSGLHRAGIETSQKRINEICEKLGTKFDAVIFESEAAPLGTEIVKEHTGNVFSESDGAVVYDGEKSGLHTRVFLNSKGLPTYEAKDLGHFTLKNKAYPNWTQSIIVTGGEQTEYFKVVYAAITELFPESKEKTLEHIPTGFLTLTTGKMSSRKGNVLTGESVLAELEAAAAEKTEGDGVETSQAVAVAALKYEILRHGIGSNIIFDKEKALSFEGASGPYLQYTHARINSVLEKANAAEIEEGIQNAPEVPYEIEKILYRFPEVLVEALEERSPQKIVTFLTEVAATFNAFYAHEKIADASDEFAPYKVALTAAVGKTLENGLFVLGIKAPGKM